ncbi:MAG: peptidylprolyl isomerase [Candidatus Thermofonsia Clade 1 bacterium]|jgi:FKBP-type peptidyl-prolyl cis-trans isomerase SlyD|uniref:Peptidyl-prolyl cis-trans isomerase n=1 Tax=Candidatus Thermofonsia Clade 1 bacterium TaxID=2364210 RepID=A0A2M8PGD6_9CHLR|nr:MAG: peptidylprolyl isomerase [Candidatus Thermofonsia Clade 1 bacterium]RMF50547.1 MAG: peptidylprolyl isomerase [Chloroflexota bacterium]
MSETIQDNVVVALAYTLKLENGEIVDQADAEEPLEYLHGASNIIPGLERALTGMRVGETKQIAVEPAEGYGDYDPEDIEVVPRNQFPNDVPLAVGMAVTLADDLDNYIEATISALDAETVTLDYNHPLAGKRLFFDVEVLGIRPATQEEIEHGHVHQSFADYDDEFDDEFDDEDFDDFDDEDFDDEEEDFGALRKN